MIKIIRQGGVKLKIVGVFPKGEEKNMNQLLDTDHALGLPDFLKDTDHELVILDSNKDVDKHLSDMDVIISSPFLPAYVTEERIDKAPNLKLAITAGVGSDHVDLYAAAKNEIQVVEVTGSNQLSVAEQVVMKILVLLRNYQEGHRQAVEGEWDLPKVGNYAHDVEGKTIGIFGFGRIGQMVAERLAPFNVYLQHNDPLQKDTIHGSKYVSFDELIKTSDVISILTPLTKETHELFDYDLLMSMKEGAYLINTARGNIIKRDDLIKVLESGHLNGYAGDVWYPQPAPSDHPWRTMPSQAMTIHYSGMTLEAQKRIEDGVKEMLTQHFNNKEIEPKNVIVDKKGKLSTSYSVE